MSPQGRIFTAIGVTAGIAVLAILGVVFRSNLFTFLGLNGTGAAEARDIVSNNTDAFCIGERHLDTDSQVVVCNENNFQADTCKATKQIGTGYVCITQEGSVVVKSACESLGGNYDSTNYQCSVAADTSQDNQQTITAQTILSHESILPQQKAVLNVGTLSQQGSQTISSQVLPVTCKANQQKITNDAGVVTSCVDQCQEGDTFEGFTGTSSVGATEPAPSGSESGSEISINTVQPSADIALTPICSASPGEATITQAPGSSTPRSTTGQEIPSTGTTTQTTQTTQNSQTGTQTVTTPTQQSSTSTTTQIGTSPTPTPTATPTVTLTPSATKTALSTTGNEAGYAAMIGALLFGIVGIAIAKRKQRIS